MHSESISSLSLNFHGPNAACSLVADVLEDCEYRDCSGVYVWAVEQSSGEFRVSYLGETEKSFYSRTKEHVIQTLGGNYRVIDLDHMRQGVQSDRLGRIVAS